MERLRRPIFDDGKLTALGRGLVVVLTAWALAVIVPDFVRVFVPLPALGFTANNDAAIVSVDQLVACAGHGAPDLRVGDAIDLHRTSPADLTAVFGGMGGMQYVRPDRCVTLWVSRGSEKPHEVTLAPVYDSSASPLMRFVSGTLLFVDELLGVGFILVGAFLFWRHPSWMTAGFWLYGLWFNPGQYFVAYAELQRFWPAVVGQEVLQSIMQGVGYAGFIIFALRFPRDQAPGWRAQRERVVPFVAAALALLQLWSFGTILGWHTETVTRITYLLGYAIDIYVIAALYRSRFDQSPVDQQRTSWVLWACCVGLGGFIFADSNESTAMWDGFWTFFGVSPSDIPEAVFLSFYMLNGFIPAAVWYALRRNHVVSVRFVVRRSFALAATWIATGTPLGAFVLLVERIFSEYGAKSALIFAPLIVGFGLLAEWTHEKVNDGCERVLFRRLHVAEEQLDRLGDGLADAEDLDALERLLVAEPASILRLASAAVLRFDDAVYRIVVEPIGWPDGTARVAHAAALAPRLRSDQCPVKLSRVAWTDEPLPRGTAQPVVAVPFMRSGELIAFGLYGLHEAGDDLTDEEIALLGKLGKAASAAYQTVDRNSLRRELEALKRVVAELGARELPVRTEPQ